MATVLEEAVEPSFKEVRVKRITQRNMSYKEITIVETLKSVY
jgi:hypothetical protein